jgi:DNA topoisomerase I
VANPADRRSARQAGLRYVTDSEPGIGRRRRGRGFEYRTPDGRRPGRTDLERIQALAVPPAWTSVWICRTADGHLQATGRDARGRKQYRYHSRWSEVRDETKYHRMLEFGNALPRIRRRLTRDLRRRGLPREKVLAAVVRLLDTTLIRVGNDEYARDNRSFGLTTVRDRHVAVSGDTIRFRFRGKSGKQADVELDDARVARVVRRCQELPGQQLFQYLNEDGQIEDVTSADVNDYLQAIAGGDFTAKDFRTWAGTVLAAWALHDLDVNGSDEKPDSQIVRAVESVAADLGNTPAVCRRCYVHPEVFDAHLDGTLAGLLERQAAHRLANSRRGLTRHEAAVLALLERRLAETA